MLNSKNLKKASQIIPSVQVAYTWDIGVGFTLITRDGVYEEIGYNYSEWPLYHFSNISNADRERILNLIDKDKFTMKDLINTGLETFACLVDEYNENTKHKIANSDFINSLQTALRYSTDDIYAFCQLERWSFEIVFFATYEMMVENFVSRYKDCMTPWTQMDDDEFESYNDMIENPGICYLNIQEESLKK